MVKLNFKIHFLILFFVTFLQSCKSQQVFLNTKSIDKREDSLSIENGFISIDNEVVIDKIKYKRFLLKKNHNLLIDGYLSINNEDSIFFIDYNSYNKKCTKGKLTFFIANHKGSHYLGRSCNDELHYPTDVLVEYKKDTIINNINYHRFSHSIISEDDYNDGSNAIIATRTYLLNYKYGLKLEKEEGEDFSPYWYNY